MQYFFELNCYQWGLCEYVMVHTILGGSSVILWISLGGKPKWLPFGYHLEIWTPYGIQISMEAILACHPARSTEWLNCHPKSCEPWRIRTGPIGSSSTQKNIVVILCLLDSQGIRPTHTSISHGQDYRQKTILQHGWSEIDLHILHLRYLAALPTNAPE